MFCGVDGYMGCTCSVYVRVKGFVSAVECMCVLCTHCHMTRCSLTALCSFSSVFCHLSSFRNSLEQTCPTHTCMNTACIHTCTHKCTQCVSFPICFLSFFLSWISNCGLQRNRLTETDTRLWEGAVQTGFGSAAPPVHQLPGPLGSTTGS